MAIFIPHNNVESDQNFGQVINKARVEYIGPELKHRNITSFSVAGIEVFSDGNCKVYLNDEVQLVIGFKDRKIKPSDIGKPIEINLHEIKNVKWHDKELDKNSAKILVARFNDNWWILDTDFKRHKKLEAKFRITRTFKVRGGSYLPLNLRKQEKKNFFKQWKDGLQKELPNMWKRHITVSQRYRGAMVYDGNYYDLFLHAQDLYVLGYYYAAITLCRTAAEQALVSILINKGKGLEIYKRTRNKQKLKSIEQLVETCRRYSLFRSKYPINKTAASKLNEISNIASALVHPKQELSKLDEYKPMVIKCMDNLDYVIRKHLNFVKDTGVVSGYKIVGSAKRLR